MLIYLVKVSLCWTIFYLLYISLLSHETFFRSNRWYLLGTLFLSLLIPYISFPIGGEETAFTGYYLNTITIGVQAAEQAVQNTLITAQTTEQWTWLDTIWGLYLLGVLLTGTRLLYGLKDIYQWYQTSEKTPLNDHIRVLTNEAHLPFSFGKYLFLPKQYDTQNPDNQKVIQHELAHIHQRHTLDVLILEALSVFFWCCPPLYGYKHSLRHIHEYLADAEVLKSTSTKQYGMLLLRQTQPTLPVVLVNHFNHSQLKKRIIMMTGKQSNATAFWKYLLLLPLALILVFAFRNADFGQQYQDQTTTEIVADGNFDPEEIKAQLTAIAVKIKLEKDTKKYPALFKEYQNKANELIAQYPDHKKEVGDIALQIIGNMGRGIVYNCEDNNGTPHFTVTPSPHFKSTTDTEIFKVVDEMPRFNGCEDKTGEERTECAQYEMLMFIYNKIKYPQEAREKGIQGTVVVRFVVDATGQIVSPEIVRSIGGGCDESVLETIVQMPDWIPGKKDGENVAVYFNLPVKFKLEDNEVVQRGLNNGKLPEILEVKNVTMSPNPSNGVFNVAIVLADKSPANLFVSDAMGKVLVEMPNKSLEETIALDLDLPAGNYYFSVLQNGKVYTESFVIQK